MGEQDHDFATISEVVVLINRNIINVGILYSNLVRPVVDDKILVTVIQNAAKLMDAVINTTRICADTPEQMICLEDQKIDILINVLGSYYPEMGLGSILRYYQGGGSILNIGARPFLIPYLQEGKNIVCHTPSNEAIRAFRVIDEYAEITVDHKNLTPELLDKSYVCLGELIEKKEFPDMKESYAVNYHFGSIAEDDAPWPDEVGEIEARLIPICGLRDEQNRLQAVPITKIEHKDGGSLLMMNFTPAQADFYYSDAGRALLSTMLESGLMDRVTMNLTSLYARYTQEETPVIRIQIQQRNSVQKTNDDILRCRVFSVWEKEYKQDYSFEGLVWLDGECKLELALEGLEEGFYKVEAEVIRNGNCYLRKETGFYRLSDIAMRQCLDTFKPLFIDTTKSTDFCLRDGKVYPIHGTTYFTTDGYRNCFLELNVFLCDQEMAQIKALGFNLIRTGIWQRYDDFYMDDGEIFEGSKRALDAFFFTAARHDLPVQFVLGAYVLNHWNRNQCPIHNPNAREKTVNAFTSFAKRFGSWPNVSIDAINEPSYSIAGRWTTARPSGDEYERIHWIDWLKKKYGNDITLLRHTWGITSTALPSFDTVTLPSIEQFRRGYDRKDRYQNYPMVTDFYTFAGASYSGWVAQIREAVKNVNPETMFMMGRDETLRIPAQQYEVYRGHFDMVNWHQWHEDSAIFAEYFLNRVRGIPCCAQELGVYHYDDLQGNMRMTEQDCARVLERKLLYSFGNWVQWQLHSDPNMLDNCEIALGLLRADKSETPLMKITEQLALIEEKMADYMMGRQEEKVRILMIHPSSYYYSADHQIAKRSVLNAIFTLHYSMKMQSDLVLENCFRKDNTTQIGDPDLIIFPAAQMISEEAWELLLNYAWMGKTVLISGCAELNEYARSTNRWEALGYDTSVRNICSVEQIKIGNRTKYTSFRECVNFMNPSKVLDKTVYEDGKENIVRVLPIGEGKLIHCPIPLETGNSLEAIEALYEFAMKQAGVSHPVFYLKERGASPNIMIYPIVYRDCVVYTIVNEGEDAIVEFTDLQSGVDIKVAVKRERGAKLWLDQRGRLLGAYLNDKLSVNGREFSPKEAMVLYLENDTYVECFNE